MQFVTNLSIFLHGPLAGALVVAIVLSLVKPWIEVSIKPDSPRHDPLIRLLAILFGILLYLGVSLATNATWNVALVVLALLNGGVIGLMSIATYHLVSGSWIPTPSGQNEAPSISVPSTNAAPALRARVEPAPPVDIDALMAQATDTATATAHDVATTTAHDVVQLGLQDVANQVYAMVRTALSAPVASVSPVTQPVPTSETPAGAQSTTRIQVAANLQTPNDGPVRLDGTLTPIQTSTPPSKPSRSKAATPAATTPSKEQTGTVSTTTITAGAPPSILLTRPSAGSIVFVDEPAPTTAPAAPPTAQG